MCLSIASGFSERYAKREWIKKQRMSAGLIGMLPR
jgi:hypothetical protein